MGSPIMPHRLVRVLLLALVVLLLFCYILSASSRHDDAGSPAPNARKSKHQNAKSSAGLSWDQSMVNITNSTLGFERVFAIGLSDRMDKKDAMTIGASLTGIDLEWVEGVRLKEMNEKSYPAKWDKDGEHPAQLAAWRAHLNVLQKIVSEKVHTALVFEDDIDWDVAIKAQLKQFAYGALALQNATQPSSSSPYGENWDVLWLGGCGARTKDSTRVYKIPDDPTVPPNSERMGHEVLKPAFPTPDKTRFVMEYADVTCSLAYAVTYESALKTLTKWSLEPNTQPFDNDLRELCDPMNKHGFWLRCIGPYPTLFGHYRKEGTTAMTSDIREYGDDWHEAFSNGIVYSTMLNAKRLATGAKTALAQYYYFQPQEVDFQRIELPLGEMDSYPMARSEPEN